MKTADRQEKMVGTPCLKRLLCNMEDMMIMNSHWHPPVNVTRFTIYLERTYHRMGVIEVDLFSEEVNSLDHPEVVQFRILLEEVAEEYDCHLLSFEIDHGTVSFSFDDVELEAEILKTLTLPAHQ